MRLRSYLGSARHELWCSLYRRTVPLGDQGPIVTFSFDDFPRNALTNGADIIERHGARATFYVAMGLMGRRNDLGQQFEGADLYMLQKRGHEIASHTFNHSSAQKVPLHKFKEDVQLGERAIESMLGSAMSRNFAYPYGEVTLKAKRELGPRMLSCRGTCPGFNGPIADLNLLRANCLYGGMEHAERARRLVLENQERKSWLVFYSHDVASNPSEFGCTPQLLETVVSLAADCGAKILTVSEVVTAIGSGKDIAATRQQMEVLN